MLVRMQNGEAVMTSLVSTIIGVIETGFFLRLLLEFFGASTSSEFVAWLYAVTDRLAGPFAGAFQNVSVGGFSLNLTIIFAMLAYSVIGWLFMSLLSFTLGSLNRV